MITDDEVLNFMHLEQKGWASAMSSGGDRIFVVDQGDCVSSIAERCGHFWETIWNHPANSELRAARDNPSVLHPGDRLVVPAPRSKVADCATGRRHRFRRRGVPAALRLRFFYGGEPRSGEPYRLTVDGAERPPSTLDDDGWLEVPIPCGASVAVVVVGEGDSQQTYQIGLGRLDPISETSGLQARLNNLGFDGGEVDGQLSARTAEALRAFQVSEGLAATGEPDEATRARLVEIHGS